MENEKLNSSEWLQSNRLGSYAMGSVDRVARRKYHSLLTVREPGHNDPLNILLDVGEYVEQDGKLFMLNAFDFGDRVEPKGFSHLIDFEFRPYPRWLYAIDGIRVERLLELDPGSDIVRLYYTVSSVTRPFRLRLRPFTLCRPWHHLTKANPFLNGGDQGRGDVHCFRFYDPLPMVCMQVGGHEARFIERGEWVENIYYRMEEERGYPCREDSYAPGEFVLEISKDCSFVFELGTDKLPEPKLRAPRGAPLKSLVSRLEWAADQYPVTMKTGFSSIIAGYPWFGNWGRDTFISLPGVCAEATGDAPELRQAAKIFESYGDLIVEGLNRKGIVCDFPEKNLIMTGIDTPLLYIRAVQALRDQAPHGGFSEFMPTVCRILNALRSGADRRVHVSPDGGLFVDHGPWAVTWMDVLMDGQPVTPRTGFAVDINALFYNAMHFAQDWADVHDPAFSREWKPLIEKADEAFLQRFWSEEKGYLADAHDGKIQDLSLRPNQLWAIALPNSPVSRERAARILEKVRAELVTPVGLRTLAPSDYRYRPTYRGGQRDRDSAYHQGTVWPWLVGIYADALVKTFGMDRARKELGPILKRLAQHMDEEGCLGQVSEVFDGDAPHRFGGTPAQAWSVAELLRVAKRMEE